MADDGTDRRSADKDTDRDTDNDSRGDREAFAVGRNPTFNEGLIPPMIQRILD